MTNKEIQKRLENPNVVFNIKYAMKNDGISFGDVNESKVYDYFITDYVNEVECYNEDILRFGLENVRKYLDFAK